MVDKRYKENRLASTLKQAGLKEDAIKLLSKLICMDPKKRMSAYDATKVRPATRPLCAMQAP